MLLANPIILTTLFVYAIGYALTSVVVAMMNYLDCHEQPELTAGWCIRAAFQQLAIPAFWFTLPLFPIALLLHARRKTVRAARAKIRAIKPKRKQPARNRTTALAKRRVIKPPPRPAPRASRSTPSFPVLKPALIATVLLAFAGSGWYALAKNSDHFDYAFAVNVVRQHPASGPTTEDLTRAIVPQYMQEQAAAAPTPQDILANAAGSVPTTSRGRMAGIFSQAAALIRDRGRLRNLDELNRFLDDNLNSSLRGEYSRSQPFMRAWTNLANDLNKTGQFPTMAEVATYAEGTAELLK